MLPLLAAGGLMAAAGQTASAASFAGTGGFGLGSLGQALGIGGLAAGLFGGGNSGFMPQTTIPLTQAGKKLETSLYESIKSDILPQNLAARYIGEAKKMMGAHRQKLVEGIRGLVGEEGTSLRGVTALGSDLGTQMAMPAGGIMNRYGAQRDVASRHMANLQNFMNLQWQTPLLRAQADFAKFANTQATGARRGAALGSIAQLAALGGY